MKIKMRVKDVIKYFDALSDVRIYQEDVYLSGPTGESEEIYSGTVLDIPWYIMDYYFYNDDNCEAITTNNWTEEDGRKRNGFEFYVVEDKEYATEVDV